MSALTPSTYDAVRDAERELAEARKRRTPHENWLHDRQTNIGCTIENLERAQRALNDADDPLAVERAVALVGQELESLAQLNRKMTCKALLLAGEPLKAGKSIHEA